ncbi:Folliculin [Trichinella pseudospiralis]
MRLLCVQKEEWCNMLNTFYKFTAFDSVLEELTFRAYIYKMFPAESGRKGSADVRKQASFRCTSEISGQRCRL